MKCTFEVGDIVELKSGEGALMTVSDVGADGVQVTYFCAHHAPNGSVLGKLTADRLPAACLQHAKTRR